MHACAWHTWHVHARAHLTRATSAGVGEAGDGCSGRATAPNHVGRGSAAAGGDGRERRATCKGRSGRFGRAPLAVSCARERVEAALRPPLRLWERG